ncbi:MAG: carbon-nitrogen hydrolase family protein [Nannocystaceae bacterium]
MHTFRAAVLQTNATADHARCMAAVLAGVHEAADRGASLVVLPENYAGIAPAPERLRWAADADAPASCSALAPLLPRTAAGGPVIIAGGTPERAADGRCHNTAFVLAGGRVAARYRKLHLFDADVPGQPPLRESDEVAPGDGAVLVRTPDAAVGLSICYDLRFGELYRALAEAGAEVLAIPAAFTRQSGAAHWDVLVRARAIETQCFVLAAAQHGEHGRGRTSFGHAAIIDPWGRVLAQQLDDSDAVLVAEIDPQALLDARTRIPTARHRLPPGRLAVQTVTLPA